MLAQAALGASRETAALPGHCRRKLTAGSLCKTSPGRGTCRKRQWSSRTSQQHSHQPEGGSRTPTHHPAKAHSHCPVLPQPRCTRTMNAFKALFFPPLISKPLANAALFAPRLNSHPTTASRRWDQQCHSTTPLHSSHRAQPVPSCPLKPHAGCISAPTHHGTEQLHLSWHLLHVPKQRPGETCMEQR